VALAQNFPARAIIATEYFRRRPRSSAPQRRLPWCRAAVSISSSAIYSTPSCTNHESRITLRFQSGPAKSRLLRRYRQQSPYIGCSEAATLPREVREHEPDSALFGGEMGTEMYAPFKSHRRQRCSSRVEILVLELGHNSAEHVFKAASAPVWRDLSLRTISPESGALHRHDRTSTCSSNSNRASEFRNSPLCLNCWC